MSRAHPRKSNRVNLIVYNGQERLGRLVPRESGVEAFDVDDNSIGVFTTQQTAADAVSAVHASAMHNNRRPTT
jgi:hypothetical protein